MQAAELMAGEAAERRLAGKSADGVAGGRGNKKPSPPKVGKVKPKQRETVARAAKATNAGVNQVAAMAAVKKSAPLPKMEIFR